MAQILSPSPYHQVGVGLYPLGALLNHSCSPNCMQSFGPRGIIEFRYMLMIIKGAEGKELGMILTGHL